jgi:hypothetical protein
MANSIWQPKQSRVQNQLDFNIKDSGLYNCSVFRYTHSHHQLVLTVHEQVDNPEPAFYLGFEGVWYLQCPTIWSGVDFELGDISERKEIINRGFLNIEENMIEAFAQQLELFVIRKGIGA